MAGASSSPRCASTSRETTSGRSTGTSRRAWASAYVKRYLEERELTVGFAVDFSASKRFGTRVRTKGDLATEVCAVLALAAARNNDRVGTLFFTDRVERMIPARKGRRHALRIISELLSFEPAGSGTDLKLALEYLESVLRRRSVLFHRLRLHGH